MRLPIVLGLLAATAACGKKSDSNDDTTSITTDSVISALNQAYPGALSLSVFPTTTTGTKSLRLDDATSEGPESLKGKKEEADKLLQGKSDDCLPPIFLRPVPPIAETCYEFDQEMLVGTRENRSFGTSTGKSTLTGSTEACLVSFARANIKEIENIIDQGLGLQQGMTCQAVKNQVDVSGMETDTGVDLKDALASALSAKDSNANKPKFTVTKANVSKDDGVYYTSITIQMTKPGSSKTITQSYVISHKPDDDTNSTYHGVISLVRDDNGGQGLGPVNAQNGKRYLSLSYTKTTVDGAARLRAELRTARFNPALEAKAFQDNGTLNFNAGADSSGNYTGYQNANEAVDGMTLVGFDLNTDNDTGSFEYWKNPGGNYNEAARGMVFKLAQTSDGLLGGCGMSGAAQGLSIRKAIATSATIAPTGSFHPFFNTTGGGSCTGDSCTKGNDTWTLPNLSDATAKNDWGKNQMSNFVTRQCVTQSTAGVYEIDTSKITDAAGYQLFDPGNHPELKVDKPTRPDAPPPPPPAPK